jgi:eukaryotic-like serine/threonine-protein kinase
MTSPQHPIANRYQLVRQLASGSFAETWLATDLMLDRYVAIKLLHPSKSNEQKETAKFLREARIAAAVSHQNIVAVFDAGSTDDRPYLVMEWVDGTSLKREITSSRRITLQRAVTVTTELLDGLSSIHEQGIIHRDIKPQNIMVNEFGTIKLTDFGIARLISEGDAKADGTTAGSAAYMAPEQAQGLPVSPASDIYAAGVIMFEMLTGRLPFSDDDPQKVILQHITDPVPRPRRISPAVPVEIEAIILKAMEKEPEDRFQSAAEMRTALRNAFKFTPARRPVFLPATEERAQSTLPRFTYMAASVAFIIVMIAGATTFAVRDLGATETIADAPEPTATETIAPAEVPTEVAEEEEAVEPEVEPAATTEPPPQSQQDYEVARSNDEYIIRGEIVYEDNPEVATGVNRPAPSGAALDDENDVQEAEVTQQPIAVAPAPTQPPPPAPTATPEPTPEPTPAPVEEDPVDETDGTEDQNGSDEDAGNPDDADANNDGSEGSEQTENNEDPDHPRNSNGTSNGDDSEDGDQNGSEDPVAEDDPPASNQGRSDDESDENNNEDSTVEDPDAEESGTSSSSIDDDDSEAAPQGRSSDDDDDSGSLASSESENERNSNRSSSEDDEDVDAETSPQNRDSDEDSEEEDSEAKPQGRDSDDDSDVENSPSSSSSSNDVDDEERSSNGRSSDSEKQQSSSDKDDEDRSSNGRSSDSEKQRSSSDDDDDDEEDAKDEKSTKNDRDRSTRDNDDDDRKRDRNNNSDRNEDRDSDSKRDKDRDDRIDVEDDDEADDDELDELEERFKYQLARILESRSSA